MGKAPNPKPTKDVSEAFSVLANVNFESNVAVYLQIENLLQFAIASGRLKPGGKLPSVREVSEQLRLNPNTIAKAYRDLEVMGLAYTRRGMGVYVERDVVKRCQEICLDRIAERIYEVAGEARAAKFSKKTFDAISGKGFSLGQLPYGKVPAEVTKLARTE